MKISKSVQYATHKHILSLDDVKEFFYSLINDLNLNFHPDNDFSDYVESGTNKPTFNEMECTELEKTLNECWEYCEKNDLCIYEVALPILQKAIGPVNVLTKLGKSEH